MIKEALSFLSWLIIAVIVVGLALGAILYLGWAIAYAWHWFFKLFLPWRIAIGLTVITTPLTLYGLFQLASNWRAKLRLFHGKKAGE